jgi:glucokinase
LFINDFEAIGYALAALHSESAEVECKLSANALQALHTAPAISAAPIACIGAGTGLGNCFCCPFSVDDGRGGKAVTHGVFCSEGGMTDTFSPRTEEEWGLKKFLMAKHGQ